MSANRKTLLCRYHYDPLDRLADCTPSAQARTQRFYLKERLTSEIQGSVQRSIFQQDDQLLAQQQRQDGVIETTLLATDQQRSVLHALDATQPHPLAYTPYGYRPAENGLLSLLGFNGERPDPVTGHYLLGNGYRAFNPVLMRFNSPDSLSPFGEGGLNAYVYCVGDPVNRNDPTGHTWVWLKRFLRAAGFMRPSTPPAAPTNLRDAVLRFPLTYGDHAHSSGSPMGLGRDGQPLINRRRRGAVVLEDNELPAIRNSVDLGHFQPFERPETAPPDYFPPTYALPTFSSENLANIPVSHYFPPNINGRRWSEIYPMSKQDVIRRTSI